jgi:hypothetical protein
MIRLAGSLLMTALALCAADVTGKWTAKVPMRDGTHDIVMEMKSEGGKVTGMITSDQGAADLLEGKLTDDELSFAVESETARFLLKGKVAGAEIRFTARRDGEETGRVIEFTAARVQ